MVIETNTDKRIEMALNRVHQTMVDLPDLYDKDMSDRAIDTAVEWCGIPKKNLETALNAVGSYVCHLADIIDMFEVGVHNHVPNEEEVSFQKRAHRKDVEEYLDDFSFWKYDDEFDEDVCGICGYGNPDYFRHLYCSCCGRRMINGKDKDHGSGRDNG